MGKIFIDHGDVVTSHMCNKRCEYCIDKFIHSSTDIVSLENLDKFLRLLKESTDRDLEILFIGGEPTVLPFDYLVEMSKLVRSYGYSPIMSTNGILKDKIIQLMPYYDWIQITVNSDADIDEYRDYPHNINLKLAGDETLTYEKLMHFLDYSKEFERKSIPMYFTPDFKELCTDERIWKFFETLEWTRLGSYMYAFYQGARFKKAIHEETNIIDEPLAPKLYPNGNYNKTWINEDLDDYLSLGDKRWSDDIQRGTNIAEIKAKYLNSSKKSLTQLKETYIALHNVELEKKEKSLVKK